MMASKISIPELKGYYCNGDIRCQRCDNKMLAGIQYYAMKTVWIEFSCVGCARGGDVELKSLNAILREFKFRLIEARYVISE